MNTARYCDTLTKLMSSIGRKRPGLLSRGVLFLDDNARPHTARNKHLRTHPSPVMREIGSPGLEPRSFPVSFTFFLHRSRHYRDVTFLAMKRCNKL
ncbi:hypothetical protein AVEN_120061-1 [Araneus ventricosus]|uniref:Tc1-like transposase DDE domain-containing protein n=1 Tax=Araneus ventricosus TaxID=182803 RepID=A0A4Y2JI20_ARAVE|nr:hypothetical protein AVEN_120061-1 [Araneus ventricosus]